jgi:hypothetical protein
MAIMARKGMRGTSLSRYNEIDACEALRIPLKPLLAILSIGGMYIYLFLKVPKINRT